ncbi:MAG: hypothetical protein HEQ40_15095 [Lacibacter sp.]|jgi:predicted small secreted protein
MKQIISIIILAILFTSCNFSKGVKKDLNTGLSTSYNGFAIEDAYLSEGEEGKKLNSNEVALGAQVNIQVTGVENYKEENGKIFPGCTLILTDKAGKELLNLPDLFADSKEGLPATEGKNLRAKLTTGDPMLAGQTYHLQCRFFDKKKADNEIVTHVDLIMK